jgi:hypothetical protein
MGSWEQRSVWDIANKEPTIGMAPTPWRVSLVQDAIAAAGSSSAMTCSGSLAESAGPS